MTLSRKIIALNTAAAAWCNGQYAGLLLIESEFDAVALRFWFYSQRT